MSGGGQSGRLWPRSSLGRALWQRFRPINPSFFISLSISGVRSKAHANMYGIKGAADPLKIHSFFDKPLDYIVLGFPAGQANFLFFHF
jgi:hypothetical protein